MKVCSKCKIDKDETEYKKHRAHRDGMASECKACSKKMRLLYEQNHPEKHKETGIKSSAKYRNNNREKVRAASNKWQKLNPEKAAKKGKRYRQTDKYKAFFKEYSKKNKEKLNGNAKRFAQKDRDNIGITYANQRMSRMGISKEVRNNPDVIESYKYILKIKRHVKKNKTNH